MSIDKNANNLCHYLLKIALNLEKIKDESYSIQKLSEDTYEAAAITDRAIRIRNLIYEIDALEIK